MKNISKYLLIPALGAALVSCTKGEYDVDLYEAVPATSVEITYADDVRAKVYTDETGSTAIPMLVGEEMAFGCAITPESVTYEAVVWSSTNEDVVTVSEDGSVKAISAGSAVITVKTEAATLIATTSIKINVVDEIIYATALDLSSDYELTKGDVPSVYATETLQMSVSISPEDATYKSVLWSSSDESIAVVDAVEGIVTGVSVGYCNIIATALDPVDPISAEYQIYVAEIVTPLGVSISTPTEKYSMDDVSVTIDVETYPDGATQSQLSWSSSDDSIATVSDKGVVTFQAPGDVTIYCEVPAGNEAPGDGFTTSSYVNLSIPAGYYYDTMSGSKTTWSLNSTHISSGATIEKQYDESTGENYWLVTPYISGKGRADIQHQGTSYLESGNYPIICVRMDDVYDYGSPITARNITLDVSGSAADGTSYSGGLNANNNKWENKYSCSDGSAILVYNMASQSFATGGLLAAGNVLTLKTLQFKYADIATVTSGEECQYRFFWFKTFASYSDMYEDIRAWTAETGITAEGVDYSGESDDDEEEEEVVTPSEEEEEAEPESPSGDETESGSGSGSESGSESGSDGESSGDDSGSSDDDATEVPAGYYAPEYSNWYINSSHVSSNGATWTDYGTYATISTTGRADLVRTGGATLHAGQYPILAFKIDDAIDLDSVNSRNITLDTSGGSANGTTYSGALGGAANKWYKKYTCSADGSYILIYDLTAQSFATGGSLPTDEAVSFSTFQLKYADIKDASGTVAASYNFYWFATFASIDDLKTYLSENSISYTE